MLRPVACALLATLALVCRADTAEPLWIDRAAAQPWRPALEYAAERTGLPVALVAELVGTESGFRNIANAHTTARGFGQQIDHNQVMIRHHLHPMRPPESILGAALELRERLDATGDLGLALRGYGTTAGMTTARRHVVEARFAQAAKQVSAQIVAQQVAPLALGHSTRGITARRSIR
jgi:soluble lytic murein transglycosylase-like protein